MIISDYRIPEESGRALDFSKHKFSLYICRQYYRLPELGNEMFTGYTWQLSAASGTVKCDFWESKVYSLDTDAQEAAHKFAAKHKLNIIEINNEKSIVK